MSFTPPIDAPLPAFTASMAAPAIIEDEDEWEYEYSNTETETYYVTLDLTTPNVPPKRRARPNEPDRRAGRWTNPGLGKQKRHTLPPPPTFSNQQPGANGIAAPTPNKTADPAMDMEDNDDDENNEAAAAEQPAAPGAQPAPRPTKVQILDLHTSNPLVAYDGHVYSCQWAENIGTEMLFKRHDPKDNTIPGIRPLPGGVDLIAMSTARIVSQSMAVKRMSEIEAPRPSKRPQGNVKSLKISVGNQALPKRKEQAAFLQRLAEIKERRGEEDRVTIHTKARPRFRAWVQTVQTKRKRERDELAKTVARGNPEDEDVQNAQARIDEIDAYNAKLAVELESRGLHPDGKRKAKHDDARKRGRTNQGGSVPKHNRVPVKKRRLRKVALLKETDNLSDGSESEAVDSESGSEDEEEGSGDGEEGSEENDGDEDGDVEMDDD